MKRNSLIKIILSVVLVIISLVSYIPVRAQDIIRTVEGDTLVTITPHQLRTINCVFTDYDWLEKKSKIQGERILKLEERSELSDSLMFSYQRIIEEQEQLLLLRDLQLKEKFKDNSGRSFWMGGIGGVILGAIITFFIVR